MIWKSWYTVRARVPNAFKLALEATTGFTKSDLSTKFQARKWLEKNTHSSTSTQISSGFPFCFQYGSEVAGLMDLMLYLYRPYYSFCVTGKLLTINWVWNGPAFSFLSEPPHVYGGSVWLNKSLHVLNLFHAEIFSRSTLLPFTFAWDDINSIWRIL